MEMRKETDADSDFLVKGSSNAQGQNLAPHGGLPSMWPGFLVGQTEQPVRVLLIDDDPHMSRVIAHELLADLRINLLGQGSSVREGRRLISQNDFDVMLVDLNLGDGTGFDPFRYTQLAAQFHPRKS